MEEGKRERYLAPGRQYGNALLGVRHQEEEEGDDIWQAVALMNANKLLFINYHPPTELDNVHARP